MTEKKYIATKIVLFILVWLALVAAAIHWEGPL